MINSAQQLRLKNQALVMKFGGTSVGSVKAMTQAVQIVQDAYARWSRLVVVASAFNGVTDMLLNTADAAARGETSTIYQVAQELRTRHETVIEALVSDLALQAQVKQEIQHLINDFTNLCQAIAILGELTPRVLDSVASIGERLSVRVLDAALECAGIPAQTVEATQLIVTDDRFQAAHPDIESTTQRTRRLLGPLLSQRRVPVVTGFLGATPEGITTTLGRGGSDYSASILAIAINASDVWIWTDVDGVMTADPRLVPDARTIPELSYDEVAEMAYFGAKVLHPKTIHPIIEAGIGLRVCNTFNPQHPGTRVVAKRGIARDGIITAVTAISGLNVITLEGRGMLGIPGVAARIFSAVATTGASIPFIAEASSEQSICFAISKDLTDKAIHALETALVKELASKDIDRIWATEEVGIVAVVCPAMRSTPGISGKIFNILGANNLNVIAISHGSSEISLSVIIKAEDIKPAVTALHTLIPKE